MLTPEIVKSIQNTAGLIRADMLRDVEKWDGQIADGKAIATMHGELAAAISALAGMVSVLATALDSTC